MLPILVILFLVGYLCIAFEHPLRIDKTATALLLGMLMWIAYAFLCDKIIPALKPDELAAYVAANGLDGESLRTQCLQYILNVDIVENMGDITQTLFFLLGAMTIVELVDIHDGFRVITDRITTRRKRMLLVQICVITFFMSALLDNLTTTIVMLMLLRKLVADQKERWLYAGMIVIAANTGGAWSPIGDVTTIMLWVKGNVTTGPLIANVLLPSIVAMLLPMLCVVWQLKGELAPVDSSDTARSMNTPANRRTILIMGIAALLFVPIFKQLTHLPPFIGILFSLGILWLLTDIFYNYKKQVPEKYEHKVTKVIRRIDWSTILFFFGILMAVAVLQTSGILAMMAGWLDEKVHNIYAVNIALGALSSVVDNVPLVAAAMGMYAVEGANAAAYAANFAVDGQFWLFLSYCAGVGGSMLIIGSAAGVIAMGIEKISFGWYLRRFSLLAAVGYLGGALVFWLQSLIF